MTASYGLSRVYSFGFEIFPYTNIQSMSEVAPFVAAAFLSDVTAVGEGLEFTVYCATSPAYGSVALRVPKCDVYESANDPHVSSDALQQQELGIYSHLLDSQVPVPRPY